MQLAATVVLPPAVDEVEEPRLGGVEREPARGVRPTIELALHLAALALGDLEGVSVVPHTEEAKASGDRYCPALLGV